MVLPRKKRKKKGVCQFPNIYRVCSSNTSATRSERSVGFQKYKLYIMFMCTSTQDFTYIYKKFRRVRVQLLTNKKKKKFKRT